MKNIDILFDEEAIKNKADELAKELYNKYKDEEVTFICILKGDVFFGCELLKRYPGKTYLDFVRITSYSGENSTGHVELLVPINKEEIKDKNIVILEDIVDTGYSLEFLYKYLGDMQPKSLESCVLLNKQERRLVDVNPTYVGFEIPNLFVVGYGLDYDQKYRNLPYIGVIKK